MGTRRTDVGDGGRDGHDGMMAGPGDRNRRAVRRTAIVLAIVVILIYGGFLLRGVLGA